MNQETKALLKRSGVNVFAILGYFSTLATFLPVMQFIKPFLRPFGVLLIVMGIFWGALRVLKDNRKQSEAEISTKNEEIDGLNREIANRDAQIVEARRRRYPEHLKRSAQQIVYHQMTLEGKFALRYLVERGPVEVGRIVLPGIAQENINAQIAIAVQHGLVQLEEERHQALVITRWNINRQYRPVLEDVLYEN
jgi:hypothetical protein